MTLWNPTSSKSTKRPFIHSLHSLLTSIRAHTISPMPVKSLCGFNTDEFIYSVYLNQKIIAIRCTAYGIASNALIHSLSCHVSSSHRPTDRPTYSRPTEPHTIQSAYRSNIQQGHWVKVVFRVQTKLCMQPNQRLPIRCMSSITFQQRSIVCHPLQYPQPTHRLIEPTTEGTSQSVGGWWVIHF